jgi:hypothetical protein
MNARHWLKINLDSQPLRFWCGMWRKERCGTGHEMKPRENGELVAIKLRSVCLNLYISFPSFLAPFFSYLMRRSGLYTSSSYTNSILMDGTGFKLNILFRFVALQFTPFFHDAFPPRAKLCFHFWFVAITNFCISKAFRVLTFLFEIQILIKHKNHVNYGIIIGIHSFATDYNRTSFKSFACLNLHAENKSGRKITPRDPIQIPKWSD